MCANWVGDNREMSPDRNNRYQIDNVGLQIGLGLPLQLLGVSLMNNFNIPRQNGNRGRGGYRRNNFHQNKNKAITVQYTLDDVPIRKLYLTNISIEVQHSEIKQIFGCFGAIKHLYLGISKNDPNKQYAFVTYINPMDAARALARHKFQDMRGRIIYAMAADSWHQPKDLPDGTVDWKTRGQTKQAKQEETSDEDEEQLTEEAPTRVETEINEGSLNMLNDDCLMHIFSFLSFKQITAVERVCKRWQALSYRMWRCLHEISFKKDVSFGKMPCNTRVLDQYLKRCGSSLTTLDLTTKSNLRSFSDHTLAVVAKHCENLEVLRVNNLVVAKRSLAHLGRSCPRLKQFVMEGCKSVTDNDLNTLLPKCPELTLLDLSSIDGFTGKCLVNVKGPVTSLRLSEISKINPVHLLQGLAHMGQTLESVTLNACNHVPKSPAVIREIVAAVPNLTSLSLSRCMMQFDVHSLSALGQLKKLTSLNLHFNNGVNDTALAAIVEGCEELAHLNLSGSGGGCAGVLSERGISMLARLRKLTHLNISYLEATTNMALKNFTARNCKLKKLVCRGCPELNDEGTETVVTLCNELELFDVSGCNGVTSKTAETAATSVKMRTNNTPLRIIVGGTQINPTSVKNEVPLLTMDPHDLSEDHLRPDFMDDMFFPPSDSDEDEDLDHLCERIAFMFGDLWEDILPSDYDDYDSSDDFDDSDIENFPFF